MIESDSGNERVALPRTQDVPFNRRLHGFLYTRVIQEPIFYGGMMSKNTKEAIKEYRWCRKCGGGIGVLADFWEAHNKKMHPDSSVK